MEISDLLSLAEIVVTILVGYYITHWITVKDQRTRTVKDYYINQLGEIRKDVDAFFQEMLDGRLNCRAISDWYGNQEGRLTSFDEGLRLALPLRKKNLAEIIDGAHRNITGTDFFNDHFYDPVLMFSNEERVRLLDNKYSIDKALNEYIILINNSRPRNAWETLIQNFVLENAYHKLVRNRRFPWLSTSWNRILKLIPYILILIAIFFIGKIAWNSFQKHEIEVEKEKQFRDSLMLDMNLHIKVQSKAMNAFLEKYKPVQVDGAKYYKNAIFNRDNKVDSETLMGTNPQMKNNNGGKTK